MSLMYLILLLCGLWTTIRGFNLDQKGPLWHHGPADSFFGYSVALHRENNNNWLLVGAPKDSTEGSTNVENGGNLYKCPTLPLTNPGDCEKVILDATGNTAEYLKSNQYMGATVSSGGIDGYVMACAPRFVWKTVDKNGNKIREPVGRCIVTAKDFTFRKEFIPCKTEKVSDRTIAGITHCEAGFSGKVLDAPGKVILGAPGSYYMQGQLYMISGAEQSQTYEGDNERDDNYRGFAVSYGEFTGDDAADILSGAPRAMYLQGQVEVFSSDLETLYNFTGDQLGSYFGASVIAADVNGDGYDDVIAGAPMYSDERSAFKDNWECGKVMIYYQESDPARRLQNLFREEPDHILGTRRQARFGYSLTSLGDINYDGYDDIAVGAPYDGEDGEGLVYIFNGNATGLHLHPTQVLSAALLGVAENITTFGFSLDGGLDADGNNYPDLLIGSQESSAVTLVRARPVVKMAPVLTLTPQGLNLEVKDHQLEGGDMVTSFEVRLCFNYQGSFIPDTLDIEYTINMDTLYTLGSRVLLSRAGEDNSDSITKGKTLSMGREWCDVLTAYVKPNIIEKLAPIQVSVHYHLVLPTNPEPKVLDPILDYASQEVAPKQVFILNNCENNLCVPNLIIKDVVLSSERIIVGSEKDVTLYMNVDNDGEDAFQASLRAHIPQGLQFVRVENMNNVGFSVTCTADTLLSVISCDLGNPLFAKQKLSFGLTLSTHDILGDKSKLEFHLAVSSQNEEEEGDVMDNTRNITATVAVQANIRINNASNPGQVHYYSEDSEGASTILDVLAVNQIGPTVEHVLDIRNDGPSAVGQASVRISWPLYDEDDKYVLYPLDVQPAEDCTLPPNFLNPDKLPETTESASNSSDRDLRKRQAPEPQYATLGCSPGSCVTFTCQIAELQPGQGYGIRVRSRFWNQTYIASGKARIEIRSTAFVQVNSMPYTIAEPPYPSAAGMVVTTALPERPPQGAIPWWVIPVAILIGLLLLLLLIVLMWKMGFFKRKKYQGVATEEEVNGKLASRI